MNFATKARHYFNYAQLRQNQLLFTVLTCTNIVEAQLMLLVPRVYPHYTIIRFGVVLHSECSGSLSSVFIYFLLDHYIVL